jgi:hypothetical protein
MSKVLRGSLGAAAIALMLGAVPLAAGRDFSASRPVGQKHKGTAAHAFNLKGTPAHAINRAAKADRTADAAHSGAATQTISLQLSGLSDTSVLVRMPAPAAPMSRSGSSVPSWTKPGAAKPIVACEPVVSALTEVAKLLEPGRCVT